MVAPPPRWTETPFSRLITAKRPRRWCRRGINSIRSGAGAISTSVPSKSRNSAGPPPNGGGSSRCSSAMLPAHCSFGRQRRARREDAIRVLQSVEEALTPGMDIMTVELRHHRLVAGASLLNRHRERPIERAGDLIDIERVDDQRGGQLSGRTSEARQHQHTRVVGILARNKLLGDKVHAVA